MTTLNKNVIYDAKEIAKYFIYLGSQKVFGKEKEREGVTNLKLQKVLYFAQAYYLAKIGRPIFSNTIEAWEFGPVVPDVYHKLKKYGNNPIVSEKDNTKISTEDKENLKNVWEIFGDYSASKLVDITHSHKPWVEAYHSSNAEISNEAIKDYYTPLLNK